MSDKKKYYALAMFPYPSGFAMHVGHASNYLITDFVAIAKKMQGYDVIYPFGYDSFGLPTENFAIKNDISALEATESNVKHYEEQIKAIGFNFDKERMFRTSDPEYYKRTQRIFKKLFEHGLVYKKDGLVNRCNGCQTVLANDQVVDGKCERCETVIIQKKHPQRYIKITDYADQLIDDLDELDWPQETKTVQKNWIGRSFGAEVDFEISSNRAIAQGSNESQDTALLKRGSVEELKGDDIQLQIIKAYNQGINAYITRIKPHVEDHDPEYQEFIDKIGSIAQVHGHPIFEVGSGTGRDADYRESKGNTVTRTDVAESFIQYQTEHDKIITKFDGLKDKLNQKHHIIAAISVTHHFTKPQLLTFLTNVQEGLEDGGHFAFNILKGDGFNFSEGIGGQRLQQFFSQEDIEEVLRDFGFDVSYHSISEQATKNDVKGKTWLNYIVKKGSTAAMEHSDTAASKITVFTTRPDTLCGVTAVVLAPENEILDSYLAPAKKEELKHFRKHVAKLTSIDRQSTDRSKTGFDSGIQVIHPLTGEFVPVWYGDYVLMDYATGAVMFVPAHDERDWEFAKRYDIEIKQVIVLPSIHETSVHLGVEQSRLEQLSDASLSPLPKREGGQNRDKSQQLKEEAKNQRDNNQAMTGDGILVNSAKFDGLDNVTAKTKITEYLESLGKGRKKKTFRLRDRSVSRQRYWGSPIPIYYTFAENEKVPYYTSRDGFPESYGNRTQPGKPVVTRHNAKVIVKHRSEDKYLIIHNETFGYHLVGGGIDAGEGFVQAAIREAKEETPYEHFQLIKELPGEVHNDFYQPRKQENRYLIEHFVVLQLTDDKQSDTHLESHESFAYHWMNPEEIGGLLQYANEQHGWFQYYDPSLIPSHKVTDRYNAYNPHPDKSKRLPHAIPDEDLPVILPLDLPNYKPAGKSPLEDHPTFKYYTPSKKKLPEGYTIELATKQDADAITYIRKRAWIETYLDPANGVTEDAINHRFESKRQKTIDGIHGLIDKGVNMHVAKYNGEIIGIKYGPHEEKGTKGIGAIYILKNHHGKGVGKALIEESLKNARNNDIYLEVDVRNENAIRFYEKLGFEKTGDKGDTIVLDNGGKIESIIMKRKGLEYVNTPITYLRECDTLDTFMCSSFYYLRFLDPKNSDYLLSSDKGEYMPVDIYVGGKEHSVGHLIYSRFIYKFLKDIGVVNNESKEPFKKLVHQGMIQGPDGRKMSKRRGNIIDPIDVIKEHGTDTLRTYIAFMGPIELQKNWNPDGVTGTQRFLKRFEKLIDVTNSQKLEAGDKKLETIVHQTIKGVTQDIDNLKFNTAISKMMIVTNAIYDTQSIQGELLKKLILLIVPFATQTAQRMRESLGLEGEVMKQAWPEYDPKLIINQTIDLPIQINGKTKGNVLMPIDVSQDEAIKLIKQDEKLGTYISGEIKKVIRVPGKICNIII